MWIYLKDAFLSIVTDRDDPERLLVRGRFAGDIERVFPDAEVLVTPEADYSFRSLLPRARVAETITAQLLAMTATNFKASVAEHWRHDLYLQVWATMEAAQRQRLQSRGRAGK